MVRNRSASLRRFYRGLCAIAVAILACAWHPALADPAPAATSGREIAIFAGGCFWGVEGVYSHVQGVISATSGYAGGTAATADYETVSTGRTGHAEAVRVEFDPSVVSYGQLLKVYFSVVADPTQRDRQGPDVGRQYRTALFPQTAAQQRTARAFIDQLTQARAFPRPIVTRLEAGRFYPAEAYHQRFMARHPSHPYILAYDRPKVNALKRQFPSLWKN